MHNELNGFVWFVPKSSLVHTILNGWFCMARTIDIVGTYHIKWMVLCGTYHIKKSLDWRAEYRQGAKIVLGGSCRYYVLTARMYDTLGSIIVLGGLCMQGAGTTMYRA